MYGTELWDICYRKFLCRLLLAHNKHRIKKMWKKKNSAPMSDSDYKALFDAVLQGTKSGKKAVHSGEKNTEEQQNREKWADDLAHCSASESKSQRKAGFSKEENQEHSVNYKQESSNSNKEEKKDEMSSTLNEDLGANLLQDIYLDVDHWESPDEFQQDNEKSPNGSDGKIESLTPFIQKPKNAVDKNNKLAPKRLKFYNATTKVPKKKARYEFPVAKQQESEDLTEMALPTCFMEDVDPGCKSGPENCFEVKESRSSLASYTSNDQDNGGGCAENSDDVSCGIQRTKQAKRNLKCLSSISKCLKAFKNSNICLKNESLMQQEGKETKSKKRATKKEYGTSKAEIDLEITSVSLAKCKKDKFIYKAQTKNVPKSSSSKLSSYSPSKMTVSMMPAECVHDTEVCMKDVETRPGQLPVTGDATPIAGASKSDSRKKNKKSKPVTLQDNARQYYTRKSTETFNDEERECSDSGLEDKADNEGQTSMDETLSSSQKEARRAEMHYMITEKMKKKRKLKTNDEEINS